MLIKIFQTKISSGFVFKGEAPSSIEIILNPIYYKSVSENIHLKGFKVNHRKYVRGSTYNSLNFFDSGSGVKLRFKVENLIINFYLLNIMT